MFSEIKLTKEQAKAKCDVCWGDCRRCALDILRKQEAKTGESAAPSACTLSDEKIKRLGELHFYAEHAATMDIRLHRFARALLAASGTPAEAPSVRQAAQAVIDVALQEAIGRVHVCEQGNGDLKAKTLSEEMQALYRALQGKPEAPKGGAA